jgi:hypothetical protein
MPEGAVMVIVKLALLVPGLPAVAWMLIVGRGTGITVTDVDMVVTFPALSVIVAVIV